MIELYSDFRMDSLRNELMGNQISVVIPLYNKRETVARAIQSVLDQTILPAEIIVVNDGSSDQSELVVKEMANPLVKLVNQPNGGVSSARNKGIREAKGEWIAFLDADDEWLPQFLESVVLIHHYFPDCNVLSTAYYNCYPLKGDHPISLKFVSEAEYQILDYFKVASSSSPPVWSSAVAIRKESLLEISGFPVGITAGEDLLTWSTLAKRNRIGFCIKAMARYRIETNLSSRSSRWETLVANNREVTKRFMKILNLSDKYEGYYLSAWFKIMAMQYIQLSLRREAFSAIKSSIRLRPLQWKIYVYLLLLLTPQWLFNKMLYR